MTLGQLLADAKRRNVKSLRAGGKEYMTLAVSRDGKRMHLETTTLEDMKIAKAITPSKGA